jgi:H/ACA ribonucleoprotein complex subunit 4
MVTLHDIAYLQSLWLETKDENAVRKFVQPMEKALELLPKIYIRDSAVDALCHGANLAAPGVLSLETDIKPSDAVAVMTQKGEGTALSKALMSTEDIMKTDHGLVAKTMRVFMPRGVYPKMWRKGAQTRKP